MPRTSSRKGPTNSSASGNSSTVDLFRAASGRAASKELERIDQLFYSYSSDGSGMIDPEGIESLCSDLEVDHTDVRILMLAWKMQAEKQGYFTLDEWRRGLKALRADTILKLKKALMDLEKEEKQKSIDIESICLLLDLVLGSQFRAQVDALIQYLKIQSDYKVINMDQWMGFYRFCNEVSFPDLSNYDPDQAWTLILDNFVDWSKSKRG
ncbi:UNVERIFIED_CONTAM: DCN1-like protein 4 [Sesamum radiatum]|uniref:Defective in cullin neddylation protein n=1 Tax=Sesamum radiatum TaxID=300843 RepID=A0AAW2VPL6_SESRA